MSSFRIYDNIPKTIVTPQIKTINIPFTTEVTGNQPKPVKFGTIPLNISILGMTAIINETSTTKQTIYVDIKDNGFLSSVCNVEIFPYKFKGSCSVSHTVNSAEETNVYISAVDSNLIGLEITGTLTISYYQKLPLRVPVELLIKLKNYQYGLYNIKFELSFIKFIIKLLLINELYSFVSLYKRKMCCITVN
jgi:hypothetical protein